MSKVNKVKYFEKDDIDSNKYITLLSYLPVLCFIPLFARRKSHFASFHAKQGLNLFIYYIIFEIINKGANYFITSNSVVSLEINPVYIVANSIFALLYFFYFVLIVHSTLGVLSGGHKPVALLGRFPIIK